MRLRSSRCAWTVSKPQNPSRTCYGPCGSLGSPQAGIVQTHKAIRAAFEWGIGRRWLKWNPPKYLDDNPSPPKKSTPKITVDQVKSLIEMAPKVHPDFPAYFLVAAAHRPAPPGSVRTACGRTSTGSTRC